MSRYSFSRNRSSQSRWHRPRRNSHRNNHNNGSPVSSSSHYISKPAPSLSEDPADVVTHQFSDFQIHEQIKKNVSDRGYTSPTSIQDQVIPHVLDGKDVVGIANTGTGKTAAFLLPLINKIAFDKTQKALIIAPTRELAMQIDSEFRFFSKFLGIYSLLCIGGANIHQQVNMLRRNPNIVIGTPGRIKDLYNKRFLHLNQFQTIVLDEVDRMLDIGFIHDIKYLISFLPKERQSLFFSATLSSQINSIIQTFVSSPVTISVKKRETAQNIEQDIVRVRNKEEKITKLVEVLHMDECKKVIVFGKTKWNVERLAKTLQEYGFSAASIHGNKTQNQRIKTLSHFKQNLIKILVATDVAARGLDIDDVTHVINFDEPSTYTDYVHRIGRTGRANKQGKALTFVF